MKKLCLIIPTYNRADCIEYYLEEKAEIFSRLGVDIIIYDTSDDDITKQITERYSRQFSGIQYERYTGQTEENAIDIKVFFACCKYAEQYDYIWFSSDGTVINVEKMYSDLERYIKSGYDMIIHGPTNGKSSVIQEYSDCTLLLSKCCWRMVLLCSVIVSSRFLKKCIERFPVNNPKNRGLWLPMAYFHTITDSPFKAVYFARDNLWSINKNRQDSFWTLSGNVLWQWGKVWCEAIDALPDIYSEAKVKTILSHDEQTKLFSLKSLVSMKTTDNLTLKKVHMYSRYIKRITKTKLIWFYVISLIPCKYLIYIGKKCYHKLKYVGIKTMSNAQKENNKERI